MEIILKGGMWDRSHSELQKVFEFNFDNIIDFDPRSLKYDKKNKQVRDYTFIIRTTEEGFDYGIHFLNVNGPRDPAVVIFVRAGWMVPNRGDTLSKKLREMAEKTLGAIAEYVEGYYDEENLQGPFQNPLSNINLNEILTECDFRRIEKIDVKGKLSDKRILLTEVPDERTFFENPYQEGRMSPLGAVWSAWNFINDPNGVIKRADIIPNYLFQSLESNSFSLKLRGTEVELTYRYPITNKVLTTTDKVTGKDSQYLKYKEDRFAYQKTAEEARIPFPYTIKIDCRIIGEYGEKSTNCHQTKNGCLIVDYKDLPKKMPLTCSEAEPKEIEITKEDIMKGKKKVDFEARKEELYIRVSGNDFKSIPVTVKVDTASPAYETLKKISTGSDTEVYLSKVISYNKLFKILFCILILVIALVVILNFLPNKKLENTQQNVITPTSLIGTQTQVDNSSDDKTYFKDNKVWNIGDLKSEEAKVFYDDVLNWNLGKIKSNTTFVNCANNSELNTAVTNGDSPDIRESIKTELQKNRNTINLEDLNTFIEKAKSSQVSSETANTSQNPSN